MLHRNSPWILGNAVINEFAEKLLPDLELTRREFLCNSTIAIYYVEITGLSINPCAHLCNMKVNTYRMDGDTGYPNIFVFHITNGRTHNAQ